MSTIATPASVDTERDGIPMTRLIKVELRKMIDTRAGFWLVTSIGIISVVIAVLLIIFANDDDLDYASIGGILNAPAGFLLPVLAILLVTSEWSQRTGLVTYTLEPRRDRVIGAKFVVAMIAGLAAVVVAYAVGAVATVVAGAVHGGEAGSWDLHFSGVFNSTFVQLLGLVEGFAFAMLLMNSAAAIVMYFVLPTALTIIESIIPWVNDHLQHWIDINIVQGPFQDNSWASGKEWAHVAVASLIWVIIPFGVGLWRLLRSEVK